MLSQYIRVIGKKGSDYTDLSLVNQDDSENVVVDYDAIYIGKQIPFNNLFIQTKVANATPANLKVSFYDSSNEFKPVVDVLDGTNGLKRSGVVQFVPNENDSWLRRDTDEMPEFSDLKTNLGKVIYNLYWLKLETDVPVDITTEIGRITYAFTTEQQMKVIEPDLDHYLSAFGQTNWEPQIMAASEEIAIDLKSRGLIIDEGQIIQFDDFALAAAYKAVSFIYFNLGPDFDSKNSKAMAQYKANLKTRRLSVDKDMDGKLDTAEMKNTIRSLVR